ncbi:MAG: hypothetical protein GQ527_11245, partial [Bacteroidales bacterium]|nr:hypothetical protein [Bacteroidales bacterium]
MIKYIAMKAQQIISVKFTLGILFLFFFNTPVKSQVWESIGPIGGDMFTCLHIDTANQILYVGTEEGFWYQDLSSEEWTSRVEVGWIGRSVKSINSYPVFPGRIITGRVNAWFKGYLELSYDWGVTNEIAFFSDGGFISDIKYSPSNPNIFYACGRSDITPGDILKSNDGGQNWSQLSNYIQVHMTSMTISPTSSNILYVSGDARITKTDDGGITWSSASNGLPISLGVYSVAMNRGDEQSLICSNDNGLYRTID